MDLAVQSENIASVWEERRGTMEGALTKLLDFFAE